MDVTCHNCGYDWEYSGDLPQTTCPACGLKTATHAEEEARG